MTIDDYESLVPRASDDVKIWRCLPPKLKVADEPATAWQFGGINRSPGLVNVIVVPEADGPAAEPVPTPVQDAARRWTAARDLTPSLHVSGPLYLPVKVSAVLRVFKRAITRAA